MDEYELASRSVGWQLIGKFDEPLGRIEQIYLDPDTRTMRWARVFDERRDRAAYVPILKIKVYDSALFTDVDAETVAAAPTTNDADWLTPNVQIVLRDYYATRRDDFIVADWSETIGEPYLVLEADYAGSVDLEPRESDDIAEPREDVLQYLDVRGGDPTGTPLEPDRPRRHFLQGRGSDRVDLTNPVVIQVRIAVEAGSGVSAELKPLDLPSGGADILIGLHAPGFQVIGPMRYVVHLPQDDSSEWVPFEIKAVVPGVHELSVTAFRDSTYLGELTLQVMAEADPAPGRSVEFSAHLASVASTDGEVSLMIDFDKTTGLYTFNFVSTDQADQRVRSNVLLEPPRAAVESLVTDLNKLARGASPFDSTTTRRWLREKGVGLWQGLVPDEVRRQFWDRADRISSLTILSSGDVIPWELLYPLDDGAGRDRGFLVEQFPVLRWVFGGTKARRLPVRGQASFVMPPNSPTTAAAEIAAVRTLLGSSGPVDPIADLDRLLTRLDSADFDLLHFACHNTFEVGAVDRTAVRMGGGPFELSFLNSLKVGRRLGERAPLVFMNACRSGGSGERYTDVTGWARAFLDAGAGAFVGSLWEVRDSSAREFAEAFYRALVTKTASGEAATLGAAVHQARAAIAERSADPTWLAYTVYGSPGAVAA